VVVTYGDGVFTRLCLESMLANTTSPGHEIIVVDNGSDEETLGYLTTLQSLDSRLRVLLNHENLGFARAANLGLQASAGRILLLLNNDTIIPPGSLEHLTTYLADPRVGMAGPGAVDMPISGPRYRTYGELMDYAASQLAVEGYEDVEMMPMYCIALRRDVFERIGPLDEGFGIGMFEDDDYCVRLTRSGYVIRRARNVYVHHFGEGAFGELLPTGEYSTIFEANKRRFEEKWGLTWQRNRELISAPGYAAMRARVFEAVKEALPGGARVAVISKGDDELLKLGQRRTWHYPSVEDGSYSGFYPKDSAEAVSRLGDLRQQGCEYLLVPESARWWLTHYRGLKGYLDDQSVVVADIPDACVIYRFVPKAAPYATDASHTAPSQVGANG
jgi:GT2 family glycosyltransferase